MGTDGNSSTGAGRVEVFIFNQTYNLRSGSDSEYVRRLSGLVDERMRRISEQIPHQDALKIAVLAALNIADELQRVRDFYEGAARAAAEAKATTDDESAAPETPAPAEVSTRSWFEDIFDDVGSSGRNSERLSDMVSAKLKAVRRASQEESKAPTDGE